MNKEVTSYHQPEEFRKGSKGERRLQVLPTSQNPPWLESTSGGTLSQ